MTLLQAAAIGRQQQEALLLLLLLLLPILAFDDFDFVFGEPNFSGNASQVNVDQCPSASMTGVPYQTGFATGNDFFGGHAEYMPSQPASTSRREPVESTAGQEETSEDKRGSSEGGEQGGTVKVLGEVDNEYIVRFKKYRHASGHQRALEKALGAEGWIWVERHNPASSFPTDFGLLRIQNDYREPLLKQLAGVNFIRDVSPQMQFTRGLAAETKESFDQENDSANLKGGRKRGPADRKRMGKNSSVKSKERDVMAGLDVTLEESQVEMKPPGRLRSSTSIEDDVQFKHEPAKRNASLENHGRSLFGMERSQITSMFEAEQLWAKGYTGAKVKMAVFDTGVRADHPHFRNIKERTNWTNEKDILNDNLGHGTFVAGVISSQDPECLGFAPDAEIYAFRVFTDAQVSYTSWFLDAFNYAIATKMNVLNLSIGGPDYLDAPFVEKVWEMTANNIIMVSAIGNDGPLYGTLNNPADQSDVIGVGGIDYTDHIASFSSRGMSTWELPHGYGRVKPDIVAYGREVIGSKITSGCKSLSGTSVASPVVAGAVCLLASVVPDAERWDVLNPASMKQALIEGATQLAGPNIYEQGAGRLNLLRSFEVLLRYAPRASVHPKILDLTDCPYMWPFCRQPLYYGAMPIIFNATVLNGMGVVGYIESPPTWTASGSEGNLLDIQYLYSDVIWPWTGYMGLHFRIKAEGSKFSGTLEGNITFTVVSPSGKGEGKPRRCNCILPVKVAVIPTPPREKRILWDQFHSIRYPPGYIPRDSLDVRNDILDWHGDHMHTNFHGMFDSLRDAGYFLESLGSPLTCFDAKQYGTLLMVDLEDEYYAEEVEKLKDDIEILGLGLVVFADWYHLDTMVKMRFFDDNTRSWWTPATGGANIPALNDLLSPFGIAFGDTILNGAYSIGGERAHFASGTDLQRFPAGGFVHRFLFQDSSGANAGITSTRTGVRAQVESPILGAMEAGEGRIAVYGDSNCLDSSHMVTNCYWLLKKLLDFTSHKIKDPLIFPSSNELAAPIGSSDTILPVRRTDINFSTYSLVLGHPMRCGVDAPHIVQGLKGFLPQSSTLKKRVYPEISPGSNTATQRQSMTSDSGDDKELVLPLVGSSSEKLDSKVGGESGSHLSISHLDSDDESDSSVQIKGVSLDGENGQDDSKGKGMETGLEVVLGENIGGKAGLAGLQGAKENIDNTWLRKTKKEVGYAIGWRQKEPDNTGLLFQWLFPVTLCMTGFLLIWSLWRVRQKKPPRRVKKGGSKSSLLTL